MKGYVKTKEAMKILGVHNQTLYRWADLGKIEIIRTPGNDRLFNIGSFSLISTALFYSYESYFLLKSMPHNE
jgi:excisionase family DNA binding protein